MTVETPPAEAFRAAFRGQILEPGMDGYDDARAIQNGLIDRRPAMIARCLGTADIVAAVNFARESGLEIAVRGGGHNVAGRSVCDDGLMIDLSTMRSVLVDPERRTARVQGGATWADMNSETQLHGLATTGGVVSTTGVAGLTLGGGLGWLMGKHGMAVDNLISAEVVTASGEIIRASANNHPDLFWAIRGGGGNFGVLSEFEFQLHPVGPMVVGGLVAYPFEAARDVLRFYRDFTANLPDETTAMAGLLHAPDGSGVKLAAILACHTGTIEEGEAAVRPIKELGTPAMDAMGPIPYSTLNSMLDDGFPKGALNYWKANFLQALSDDVIDTMIARFEACPSPMSGMILEHFHGAVTRVPATETAFPLRDEAYNLVVAGEWLEPSATEHNIAWVRESYDALSPFMSEGRYVNYLPDDEATSAAAQAFGVNYQRLQSVKKQYDPGNVFHLNQNVTPA